MSVLPIRSKVLGLALSLALLGIPPVSRAGGLSSPRPPALTGLESVHAAFISGAGEAGIRSAQMFLDGREVTGGADVDSVRVAYTPTEKLSVGTHSAKVIVIDALGRSFVKEWSFEVLAQARPELIAFFSDALAIDLDPLPRRSLVPRATVVGTTLPGAEVSVRVEQGLATRVIASANGRFSARVDLARGENELTISAARLDLGQEGVELTRRIEHVVLAAVVATRPPTTWTGDPGRDQHVARPVQDVPGADIVDIKIPENPNETEPPPPAERVTPKRPIDERVAQRVDVPPLPDIIVLDPDDPDDDEPPPPPMGEVVITKPSDGASLHASHVTVLGRAPAGWNVILLVDGHERGDDVANPAGHFTMPRVELGGGGEHQLMAEATSSAGETLRSVIVTVRVSGAPALSGGDFGAPRGSPSTLSIQSPARGTTVVRERSLHVEGVAWDGAQVDVEVNGRVVATEIAGSNGRFILDVPLEIGSNLLVIEAGSQDGSRLERSQGYLVSAPAAPRVRQGAHDPVPIRGGPPRGFPGTGNDTIRPRPGP